MAWTDQESGDLLVVKINNLTATTAPTANDDVADGYFVGSVWIDNTNDNVYQCVDSTEGAAIWKWLNGTESIFINVKDPAYGATGDGTTDDSAAINAAITAANAAGGGIVFFPEGTYLLSTHASGIIIANRSNITYMGTGFSSIIKKGAFGSTDVEMFKGACSNTRWTNLKFDMNGTNNLYVQDPEMDGGDPTPALMGAIRADSGDNLTVDNCWFTNQAGQRFISFGNGSVGTRATDVLIHSCRFDTTSDVVTGNTEAYDHTSVYLDSNITTVANCAFYNASQSTTSTAIESHGSYTNLHDNTVDRYNIAFILAGIYNTAREIRITDNVVTSCRQWVEFYAASANNLDEVIIANNSFDTNTSTDPLLDLGEHNQVYGGSVYILNNSCQSTAGEAADLGCPAVNIGRFERVFIEGNTFKGITGRVIEFDAGTYAITANNTNLYIHDNKFIDCCNNSVGGAGLYAVHIASGVALDDVRITGNEFVNDARSKMTRGVNFGDNCDRLTLRLNYGNVAVIETVSGTVSTAEYVPPVALALDVCTGDTTTSDTTPQDITGISTAITPAHDCVAIVRGIFDVAHTTVSASEVFEGLLDVNTSTQTGKASWGGSPSSERGTAAQTWHVNLTAGTAYTFKLQASQSASGGVYTVYQTNTTMSILLLPRY